MDSSIQTRDLNLAGHQTLMVRQVREWAELFGFETRNKYEILDQNKQLVAFAAEQGKGFFDLLMRQWFGHWRKFSIHFFTPDRARFMVAHRPFRFFFQRLEIIDHQGAALGAIQQRWSLASKRFEVQDPTGRILFEVSSPLWRLWTFPFLRQGREMATVQKKWSGMLTEMFSDKDTFMINLADPNLTESERKLILASSLYIDLQYFEDKAG